MITKLVVFVLAVMPALAFAEPDPPDVAKPGADVRKACTDAMNADPAFAKQIVEVADANAQKHRDELTLLAHQDAADHIAKNERHVIYAYSAMWGFAALFVIFLWRRQQKLTVEIIQLRTDLAAAAKAPDPIEPVPSK